MKMDRKAYEKDLKKRQKKHLKNVRNFQNGYDGYWTPCAHDSCPQCIGTGVRHDGSSCVHYIYCSCPKCSPTYFSPAITWTSDETNLAVTSIDTGSTFLINTDANGSIVYTSTNTWNIPEVNAYTR